MEPRRRVRERERERVRVSLDIACARSKRAVHVVSRREGLVREGRRNELGEVLEGLAYRTIGAAIEVHRLLGPGYLESIYHKALEVKLRLRRG